MLLGDTATDTWYRIECFFKNEIKDLFHTIGPMGLPHFSLWNKYSELLDLFEERVKLTVKDIFNKINLIDNK